MSRLWGTLGNDVRLQWRNGFYYAAAVMLAMFTLLLSQVRNDQLGQLLPAVIVNNAVVNGFYFVGGLMLLEKNEGSLQAQAVTPLRASEYLAGKILSLTLLTLVENGLLALILIGGALDIAWLFVGVVTGVCFYTLTGFMVVVRFETISEYLLPSMLVVTLLALPLLPYFGVGNSALLSALAYFHPLQAVLLALRGATGVPLAGWQVAYILAYLPVVLAAMFVAAKEAYEKFVRQTTLQT